MMSLDELEDLLFVNKNNIMDSFLTVGVNSKCSNFVGISTAF